MSEGISESRFYMWRAVFSMAHADHVVTDEERSFMEGYLAQVPFSDAQRSTLEQDMAEAQDVYEMFDMITEPEDRGQFFEFARMMCWSDGDYDAQEEEIKEYLKESQLKHVNADKLELELRQSRAIAKMKSTAEGRSMNSDANSLLGLGALFKGMISRENKE